MVMEGSLSVVLRESVRERLGEIERKLVRTLNIVKMPLLVALG